jgi:hypothetical protein
MNYTQRVGYKPKIGQKNKIFLTGEAKCKENSGKKENPLRPIIR